MGNANLKTIRKSFINQQWTKDVSCVLMKPTLTQRSSQGIVLLLSSYCKLQQTQRPASQFNCNLFLSWGSKCQADRLLSDKEQAQSLCQRGGGNGWRTNVKIKSKFHFCAVVVSLGAKPVGTSPSQWLLHIPNCIFKQPAPALGAATHPLGPQWLPEQLRVLRTVISLLTSLAEC